MLSVDLCQSLKRSIKRKNFNIHWNRLKKKNERMIDEKTKQTYIHKCINGTLDVNVKCYVYCFNE